MICLSSSTVSPDGAADILGGPFEKPHRARRDLHHRIALHRIGYHGRFCANARHHAQADALKTAVANKDRAEAHKVRDAHRHPAETLAFFGIKPNMTVIEIAPGSGYYAEILSPYLKSGGGRYIETGSAMASLSDQAKWGVQSYVPFNATSGPLAPAGSADMVVTFRNIHNWMWQANMLDKAMADFAAALKPGGVLASRNALIRVPAPEGPPGNGWLCFQGVDRRSCAGPDWFWKPNPRSTPTRRTRKTTPSASGPCPPTRPSPRAAGRPRRASMQPNTRQSAKATATPCASASRSDPGRFDRKRQKSAAAFRAAAELAFFTPPGL
jgi:hypothetical protein